jgi:hypothetical protein
MGWTDSSDEGNNKCKWKLDGDGHTVKKGDCVGDLKMDVSKRGCWTERWMERNWDRVQHGTSAIVVFGVRQLRDTPV